MSRINVPTAITLSRIILSIIFFVFVLQADVWAKAAALVLFIIAAITDRIDGYLARKNNQVTSLGAFLDPLADKMLVNLALLALTSLGVVPVWVFAIILIRDFAVDGVRMESARQGKTIAASIYGKLKTATQMVAIIVILLNLILDQAILAILGDITLYLALVMTVISGAKYVLEWAKTK